jgi:hypothetical protein
MIYTQNPLTNASPSSTAVLMPWHIHRKHEDKALVFAQVADKKKPSQPKDEGSSKSSSSSTASKW